MLRFVLFLLFSFYAHPGFAGNDRLPVAQVAERAIKLSQLTAPGSAPFHLKATIAELDSPDSDYKAEVEEFWVSPSQWRQVVTTADYSQTKIVNGDKVLEQTRGDYEPHWLREFLTALFDPLPMLPSLKQGSAEIRSGGANSVSCVRFEQRVGSAPLQNSVFTSICFRGDGGIESVMSPGYSASFKDFKAFKDKRVPYRIVMDPEPGTTIEARITELSGLSSPDPLLFTINDPTPEKDRIQEVRISESVARKNLLSSPEINWNPVRDGKTHGMLSIYVCIDRDGRVRETYPLNSDNPFPQDQARKEVMGWTFKPMLFNGALAQVETILTFAYETKIENPIPVLSDAEARKLATSTAEPELPSRKPAQGTAFTVRVAVDEAGNVMGVNNINHSICNWCWQPTPP